MPPAAALQSIAQVARWSRRSPVHAVRTGGGRVPTAPDVGRTADTTSTPADPGPRGVIACQDDRSCLSCSFGERGSGRSADGARASASYAAVRGTRTTLPRARVPTGREAPAGTGPGLLRVHEASQAIPSAMVRDTHAQDGHPFDAARGVPRLDARRPVRRHGPVAVGSDVLQPVGRPCQGRRHPPRCGGGCVTRGMYGSGRDRSASISRRYWRPPGERASQAR